MGEKFQFPLFFHFPISSQQNCSPYFSLSPPHSPAPGPSPPTPTPALTPLLYACYAVGLALTACSDDSVMNLAWDSGGITTDTITVLMVMSLGLRFGGALR